MQHGHKSGRLFSRKKNQHLFSLAVGLISQAMIGIEQMVLWAAESLLLVAFAFSLPSIRNEFCAWKVTSDLTLGNYIVVFITCNLAILATDDWNKISTWSSLSQSNFLLPKIWCRSDVNCGEVDWSPSVRMEKYFNQILGRKNEKGQETWENLQSR